MDIRKYSILTGYRGSRAHGMETADTDDVDLMSVVIPPLDYYLGQKGFEVKDFGVDDDGIDLVVYEYRKFIHLLLKGNPNVLSFLWNREDMFTHTSDIGWQLIKHKHLFNAKVPFYKATKGYALSQLKKMYHPSQNAYKQSKRKENFEKFGYDTKNAAHLIRLLVMGIEFLRDGMLYVHRQDANYFLNIKTGKWKQSLVERTANVLLKSLDDAFERSGLPEYPDYEKINTLTTEWLYEYIRNRQTGHDVHSLS